jgi:beta-N-acetylhexosaminidase
VHRARLARIAVPVLAIAAALLAAALLTQSGSSAPSLDRMVGQTIMTSMAGTTPDASLLARVRAGQVGGVILFGANVVTRPQVSALVARLQQAAKAGGNPPLLIATDQEGGPIRRFHSCPPFQSAQAMGSTLAAAQVTAVGRATGTCLRSLGVSVNLAPVLDVPSSPSNFLGSRAFSENVATVARLGPAFATGVQQAHDAATAKHFPGLGTAPGNTDLGVVVIHTSKQELMRRLGPYPVAIRAGVKLVMVSNASYPELDPSGVPALISKSIVTGLLRGQLGFHGVVITDSITAPGPKSYAATPVRALKAGVDVLLYADLESVSAAGYQQVLRAAQTGSLPRSTLQAADARIAALKAWLYPTR